MFANRYQIMMREFDLNLWCMLLMIKDISSMQHQSEVKCLLAEDRIEVNRNVNREKL